MPAINYSDISPRTEGFAASEMLKRGTPHLVITSFGQGNPIPKKSSKTQKWRRYNALPTLENAPAAEGVTPSDQTITHTDVTATLNQYIGVTRITDVVEDTHEDPVLKEFSGILGEQAAQTVEKVYWNVIKAGTNVVYANSVSERNQIAHEMTLVDLRKATRALKRQNAKFITHQISSDPNFNKISVPRSFIGLIHPDLENVVKNLPNFKAREDYAKEPEHDSEVGACDGVRFITSTVFEAFADAGGPKGSGVSELISGLGTHADVYPCLLIAEDAYGVTPLRGAESIEPFVALRKASDSDPAAQRTSIAWKTMQAAEILNDLWMVRLESAVRLNPTVS